MKGSQVLLMSGMILVPGFVRYRRLCQFELVLWLQSSCNAFWEMNRNHGKERHLSPSSRLKKHPVNRLLIWYKQLIFLLNPGSKRNILFLPPSIPPSFSFPPSLSLPPSLILSLSLCHNGLFVSPRHNYSVVLNFSMLIQ